MCGTEVAGEVVALPERGRQRPVPGNPAGELQRTVGDVDAVVRQLHAAVTRLEFLSFVLPDELPLLIGSTRADNDDAKAHVEQLWRVIEGEGDVSQYGYVSIRIEPAPADDESTA